MDYHVVLRRSWQDVSGLIHTWANKVNTIAAAEHQPDNEEARTHCHVLMFGAPGTKKNNPLRDMQKQLIPDYESRTASWMTETLIEKKPLTLHEGLVYLLKGGHEARLVYQKNIPAENVEAAERDWVVRPPSEKTIASNKRKQMIDTIVSELESQMEYNKYEIVYSKRNIISNVMRILSDNYYDMSEKTLQSIITAVFYKINPDFCNPIIEKFAKNFIQIDYRGNAEN